MSPPLIYLNSGIRRRPTHLLLQEAPYPSSGKPRGDFGAPPNEKAPPASRERCSIQYGALGLVAVMIGLERAGLWQFEIFGLFGRELGQLGAELGQV